MFGSFIFSIPFNTYVQMKSNQFSLTEMICSCMASNQQFYIWQMFADSSSMVLNVKSVAHSLFQLSLFLPCSHPPYLVWLLLFYHLDCVSSLTPTCCYFILVLAVVQFYFFVSLFVLVSYLLLLVKFLFAYCSVSLESRVVHDQYTRRQNISHTKTQYNSVHMNNVCPIKNLL